MPEYRVEIDSSYEGHTLSTVIESKSARDAAKDVLYHCEAGDEITVYHCKGFTMFEVVENPYDVRKLTTRRVS